MFCETKEEDRPGRERRVEREEEEEGGVQLWTFASDALPPGRQCLTYRLLTHRILRAPSSTIKCGYCCKPNTSPPPHTHPA